MAGPANPLARHAYLPYAADGQDPRYPYTSDMHVHNAVGSEYRDMHQLLAPKWPGGSRARRIEARASCGALVGMASEQARRFLVGEMPPLARGFASRPETAAGIADALVPGTALALVPRSFSPGGSPDWRSVCGKTQIAVMIAESLW